MILQDLLSAGIAMRALTGRSARTLHKALHGCIGFVGSNKNLGHVVDAGSADIIAADKAPGSTPAAGPPLEPAGVLSRSYGFRTAPANELREKVGENAHSPMFPFPKSTAPAPFNRATFAQHAPRLRHKAGCISGCWERPFRLMITGLPDELPLQCPWLLASEKGPLPL